MLTARLFYFLYFAGLSSWIPYLTIHYQDRGMTGTQVGILTALLRIVTMFAAPLWSALADATRRHKALLLIATAGAPVSILVMSQAQTFAGLLLATFFYAACMAPILPIVDSTVLLKLGPNKQTYGRMRMLGSLSPALMGPLVSTLVGRAGLSMSAYSFMICFVLVFLLLTRFEVRTDNLGTAFHTGLGRLLKNRRFGSFLLVAFLGMAGYAAIITYLYVRLEELGASPTLIGFALTVGTIGELPFLFFSANLLKRFGARGTLICSLVAISTMLLGFSMVKAPWILLVLQLLHGTAFSGLVISGVAYAAEIAPPGLSTTAQGIFSAVYGGLALAVGAFTSSVVREHWGSPLMFLVASGAALSGLIILLATNARGQAVSQQTKPV